MDESTSSPAIPTAQRWPALRHVRAWLRNPRRRITVWLLRAVQRSGYLGRVLWLCIYPLTAFIAGVAMLGVVDQTREFYAQFGSRDAFAGIRASHAWWFGAAVIAWAVALWYASRLLLTQDYRRDDPIPQELTRFAERTRIWLPRGLGYFGLLAAACMLATYAPGRAGTDGLAALCVLHVAMHAVMMSVIGHPVRFAAPILACVAATGLAAYAVGLGAGDAAIAVAIVLGALLVLALVGTGLAHRVDALRWTMLAIAIGALAVYGMRVGTDRRLIAAAVAVAASAFFVFTIERRRWFARLFMQPDGRVMPAAERHTRLPRGTRNVMAVALAVFAALILGFYAAPHLLGEVFGSLAIVFIGFAVWMMFGVLVFVHWPKRNGLPSLALLPLVLVAIVSTYADNHALYATDFRAGPDPRPALVADFERWQRARIDEGDAPDAPVFFVAAAGGGLRAAHWTARMLAAMDDATCDAFGRRVYAISGVSGGSLGAATYVALKADQHAGAGLPSGGAAPTGPGAATPPCRVTNGQSAGALGRTVGRVLGRDFLAPVVGSFLFTDAFQRWIPTPIIVRDRGWVLAEHWAQGWRDVQGSDRFHAALPALYADDAQRRLPMLFLNATSVDTGRRVIASGVHLYAPDAIDLYDADLKTDGLPLAQAVLNSARFTYVSPAGTLIGRRGDTIGVADRLVDGGYFDNSGAETVLDVIAALERAGVLRPGQAHVVLISNEATAPRLCRDREPAFLSTSIGLITKTAPTSSETLSPIETMLSTRVARSSLAMDRVVRQIGCDHVVEWGMYADRYPPDLPGGAREPALGWFLSRSSVRLIDALATEYSAHLPYGVAGCPPSAAARAVLITRPQAPCD